MFSVKLLAQSNSPVFPAVCTHNVDCPSVVGQKEAGAPSPSSFALPPLVRPRYRHRGLRGSKFVADVTVISGTEPHDIATERCTQRNASVAMEGGDAGVALPTKPRATYSSEGGTGRHSQMMFLFTPFGTP